jgi:hypothetical protein
MLRLFNRIRQCIPQEKVGVSAPELESVFWTFGFALADVSVLLTGWIPSAPGVQTDFQHAVDVLHDRGSAPQTGTWLSHSFPLAFAIQSLPDVKAFSSGRFSMTLVSA